MPPYQLVRSPKTKRQIVMRVPRALAVFAFVLLGIVVSDLAPAQCICTNTAQNVIIGTGCGAAPVPTFNATAPIVGQLMTFYVQSSLPNAPLLLASSHTVAAPFFVPGG